MTTMITQSTQQAAPLSADYLEISTNLLCAACQSHTLQPNICGLTVRLDASRTDTGLIPLIPPIPINEETYS